MIFGMYSNGVSLVPGTDAVPGIASHKLLLEEGI